MDDKLESRLDSLIDGELAPDEYRALLATLDTVPDGWRRCALSFLESQALGAELGTLRRSLDERPPAVADEPAPTPSSVRRTFWRSKAFLLPAIAASFLAAFALGIVAPQYFSLAPQEPRLAGNSMNRNDQPFANPAAGNRHAALRPVVGNVSLVMDGANGESIDAGQVPVYEASADWKDLLNGQQAMGPEFVELLKRHGFDVQHEQRYVPAPLDDGRQLIVPVDGYQIVPIGGRY